MDFDLSDDQQALRDAATALLDARAATADVRRAAAGDTRLDSDLWAAMAEQGWLAVERPDGDGGLGLGLVEAAVLAEEVGRHVAPVPFTGSLLALGALGDALVAGDGGGGDVLAGSDVAGWVRRLANGGAVGAVAWSSRPDAVIARRAPAGDGWVLQGRPDPVVYGPAADVVVVFAVEVDGDQAVGTAPSLFVIAPGTDRPRPEPAMDVTRTLGWLDVAGRPARRVGGPDEAQRLLDRAATLTCAEMLGAADRVLAMTVGYAKDRVQFGRPIGSFQAVKHRCADMLVDVEGMRSAGYFAAWAVGAGDPESSTAASAAKIWCSDASRRVMASALQVHGGIGFTWEHDLHLFLKRAHLDQVSFGDAAFHRRRLAAELRPRVEAGAPIF